MIDQRFDQAISSQATRCRAPLKYTYHRDLLQVYVCTINLLSETKEFVSELFNTLKTKTYLPTPPPQPTTPTQSTSQNASVPQASNEAIVNSVNDNSAVPGCSEKKQEAKGPPPRKPSSEKVF